VTELARSKNIVMQQLEHDDMTSERSADTRANSRPPHPKEPSPGSQPTPSSGSPLANDGLERVRDINC
jgi:hypothetical protein